MNFYHSFIEICLDLKRLRELQDFFHPFFLWFVISCNREREKKKKIEVTTEKISSFWYLIYYYKEKFKKLVN